MTIIQALAEPDKKALPSLTFKVVSKYPGEPTQKGGVRTRVLVDSPQSVGNTYVTFFTDTDPVIEPGKEYIAKAEIGPRGPFGISVNVYNGTTGFNIFQKATIEEVGSTGGYQEPAQTAQASTTQPAQSASVEDSRKVDQNLDQQIARFKEIYDKAYAHVFQDFQETTQCSNTAAQWSNDFAIATVSAVPTYWFGLKDIPG